MTAERFQDLFETVVDRDRDRDRALDETASRELLEAFAADPALKQRFLDELRTANQLHGLALHDKNEIAPEVIESIRLGNASPDLSGAVVTELRESSPKIAPFPWRRLAGIGLAAALALAFLVLRSDRAEPLATLAQTVDAQWPEESIFNEGTALGPGRIHLLSGLARLDFPDGVRVTLEGPAEFELVGPGETRLHSGVLTAHVPPEGVGFQVHTEKIDVTDLGTTFGVSVDKKGSTDVLVFEGEIEVAAASGARKRSIIREGNAVSVANTSTSFKPARFEPRSFRNGWPVLFGVLNTGGQIKFVNAQPITDPMQVEDHENIIIFPERFGSSPRTKFTVTITEPGSYTPNDLIGREEVFPLDDRRVNTYLLQYNPPHLEGSAEKNVPFTGEVTFDRPILAVIANRDQLQATDGGLGKKRFTYETRLTRGLEHGDHLHLSEDRRTLGIDWLVMPVLKHGMDQVRVIVDAGKPADR